MAIYCKLRLFACYTLAPLDVWSRAYVCLMTSSSASCFGEDSENDRVDPTSEGLLRRVSGPIIRTEYNYRPSIESNLFSRTQPDADWRTESGLL